MEILRGHRYIKCVKLKINLGSFNCGKLILLALLVFHIGRPAQALMCRVLFANYKNQQEAEMNEVREIWLAFARKSVAHSDFKYISDLVFEKMSTQERRRLLQVAKDHRKNIFQKLIAQGMESSLATKLAQTVYARRVIELFFVSKTQLKNVNARALSKKLELIDSVKDTSFEFKRLQTMFSALEATWPHLVKRVVHYVGGSLLKVKEYVLIAGGRFREPYYWDTVFGTFGLLSTNRVNLVVHQLKKFVNDINEHGFIYNGGRKYYDTRSQPPMVTVLVRNVFEGTRGWSRQEREKIDDYLLNEALPALEKDYGNFWMSQRYDPTTGLNFHFDNGPNRPRPERHSKDNDYKLAETPLDTKSQAEKGTDFENVDGGRTSKVLPVQLNALLYGYERDLAWLYIMKANKAPTGGRRRQYEEDAARYSRAAEKRAEAIKTYLRSKDGLYRNYDRVFGQQVDAISGEIFALLFTKVLSQKEADQMIPKALALLEKPGGIAASTLFESNRQWDGNHGWAPFQMMAIQGLINYGYHREARRIAKKWLQTNLNVFEQTGQFYEKVDVETMQLPKSDNSKYENQVGFLWTNSSLIWVMDLLGYRFE